jgi:hypothetical protein
MKTTAAGINDDDGGLFAVYRMEDASPQSLTPPLDPAKRIGLVVCTREYLFSHILGSAHWGDGYVPVVSHVHFGLGLKPLRG